MLVQIRKYDVIGNPVDGFEVNDSWPHSEVEYDGDWEDDVQLTAFVSKNFFKTSPKKLYFDRTTDMDKGIIYVEYNKYLCCELQKS